TEYTGLAGGIGRHAALPYHPRDRAEIDDSTGIRRFHIRQHCLRSEELVLQVNGDAVVPMLRRHFLRRMTLIVGCIVDEDIDWSVSVARVSNGGAQRGNIGKVDV